MAVPKKKVSRHRMRQRSSAYRIKLQAMTFNRVPLVKCYQCSELKMMHTVCKACGAYSPSYTPTIRKTEETKKSKKEEKKQLKMSPEAKAAQAAKEQPRKPEDKGRPGMTKSTFFRRKAGGGGS